MRTHAVILSSILSAVAAAPAIVWQNKKSDPHTCAHSSRDITSAQFLGDVLIGKESNGETTPESLNAVVFVLGKDGEGSESLRKYADAGELPALSQKYREAEAVYHHVSGIDSIGTISRDTKVATRDSQLKVFTVSMEEFNGRMDGTIQRPAAKKEGDKMNIPSKTQQKAAKRATKIVDADVLIVSVEVDDAHISDIDTTIAKAIDTDSIDTVILSSIRGTGEMKNERYIASKERHDKMEKRGQKLLAAQRRRLEEENGDNADNGNDNDNQNSGVYFVHMTPNILAGLLFFLLFTVITYIGITCMGAIASQDVYVTKMPTVGREA